MGLERTCDRFGDKQRLVGVLELWIELHGWRGFVIRVVIVVASVGRHPVPPSATGSRFAALAPFRAIEKAFADLFGEERRNDGIGAGGGEHDFNLTLLDCVARQMVSCEGLLS